MSTNPKLLTQCTRRNHCAVCGRADLQNLIDLPRLPLTDCFSKKPMSDTRVFDQELLQCENCGHGQLAQMIDPRILYGENYHFRTSMSSTAKKGTDFFMGVLRKIARGRRFQCAVDLGCNDTYLLKLLEGVARSRIGIDPIWASNENPTAHPGIQVIGSTIEEIDLKKKLPTRPDLILCRHTLEHLADPLSVLRKLFEAAADQALFIFEVPRFESLVMRCRFDQVFHQHLQYFTLDSLRLLFEKVGGIYLSHEENYHDWGAMAVVFKKSRNKAIRVRKKISRHFQKKEILQRYFGFLDQMKNTNRLLNSVQGQWYGYGAAQMLPVLAYHLKNDFLSMAAVLDDDSEKDGCYYSNLPVVIRHSQKIKSLENSSVLITAVDNVVPILGKLLPRRPRHIIYPLHII